MMIAMMEWPTPIEGCNVPNIVLNGGFSIGSTNWTSTNFASFSGVASYAYDASDAAALMEPYPKHYRNQLSG